eukprot:CAMPEP_0181090700 /NCGR_PEP_ID=MMETSP1071-20121207/8003_1 /TAXON_ID=35127 /ORGANISM="Thalassiosira sp., Strain NH16" /LENGTH=190 /DNA_ID=CAMNT_0023172787 /DNA_START=15 /DNA_END=584 /DNA_ORIENTATION=+
MLSSMIRHSRYSVKRRSTTALAYSYCLASKMMDGNISVAAFREVVPPGDTYDVVDPGASAGQHDDGSAIIAQVQRMGREDTKRAIDRASAALGGWKDGTTALHRSGILSKWSELIKENTQDIAKIMTLESGKPLHESIGEITYGTGFLDYYAAEAIRPNSAGGGSISPSPFVAPDGGPRGKIMAMNEAVG